ncbi:cytochrome P450 [Nocardiopsis changdeensis]|uniref:Cytochrome P450 n=1 Tax=Nocardiopsis changdeensis TaxID=2831969 RepID=A0ABX8BST2_9ACTN|nr:MULTISPECIES: cytochrome P450 [Nocardiopsis]QUX25149.1 cytochrome P450 [Nocardiopsis changdeensis]QYX35536.1 cytochrome P450 [Nocardiopsis sp. MT53]
MTNTQSLTPLAVLADDSRWRRPEEMFAILGSYRRERPVALAESPDFRSFWLVTRHEDITSIERRPELFTNRPGPLLEYTEPPEETAEEDLKPLPHRDGEDHRAHRAIAQNWFRYKAISEIEKHVAELARQSVDELLEQGPECDFVETVAARFPLRTVMALLGLPDESFERMYRSTQTMAWEKDPEGAQANWQATLAMFARITESRRAEPTSDLASAIANGRVNGELLVEPDLTTYYMLIADAGYETTAFSLAGGLYELMRHPDQLALLRAEPELIPNAVEEILRWTSPVRHFLRTAQEDTEVRGVEIRKGERVMLSYPAANRDEEVFADSERFDVTRTDADRHLAFGGYGPHHCIGAPLSRMEIRLFLTELLDRTKAIEPAGEAVFKGSAFLGGVCSLPVRITPASCA